MQSDVKDEPYSGGRGGGHTHHPRGSPALAPRDADFDVATSPHGATQQPSEQYAGTPLQSWSEQMRSETPVLWPIGLDAVPSPQVPKNGSDAQRATQATLRSVSPTLRSLELARHTRRLSKLLDKVLLLRTQYEHRAQTLASCRRYQQQSTAGLMLALNRGLASAPGSNEHEQSAVIAEAYEQYRADYETTQDEESKVMQLAGQLSEMEYKLRNIEEGLTRTLKSLGHVLKRSGSEVSSHRLSPSHSTHERSGFGDIHPLLAEYFDRKGDVSIMIERLHELQFDHSEGLLSREILADRGDALDTTDQQFQNEFIARRDEILRELEAAEADTVALKAQCEAAGLDTVIVRESSISSEEQGTLAVPDVPLVVRTAGSPVVRSIAPQESDIESWLTDVLSRSQPSLLGTATARTEDPLMLLPPSLRVLPATHSDMRQDPLQPQPNTATMQVSSSPRYNTTGPVTLSSTHGYPFKSLARSMSLPAALEASAGRLLLPGSQHVAISRTQEAAPELVARGQSPYATGQPRDGGPL